MSRANSVPGPGEVRKLKLPKDSDAGIRYELARMIKFIQEGRKDPLVIETAREVAVLSADTYRQLGLAVTDENRSLIHLAGLHAWCHDRFEYVNDPVGIELIQTPARLLRRLEIPAEIATQMWTPIRKAMAAGKEEAVLTLPKPKMAGDSDEAVVVSLALAAALGIEPLKMRLGGHDGMIHYVWGAAWAAGTWHDFDILHATFGEHGQVEPMEDMAIPL